MSRRLAPGCVRRAGVCESRRDVSARGVQARGVKGKWASAGCAAGREGEACRRGV